MARRGSSSVESTPNYGTLREPNLVTIKMYYNGRVNSNGKHDDYIGGSFEYFDFFDLDKLSMVELWGFAEDLGFIDKYSVKFWHKFGYTFKSGRYLENDSDVLEVRNHIPRNYEVEIFLENLDVCASVVPNLQVESEFVDDDNDFIGDGSWIDAFVEHETELTKGKKIVDDRENIDDLQIMTYDDDDDEEEDVCADIDDLDSLHDSDEGEIRNYPKFNPEKDSENPSFKIGMIFCSKKEVKFAIESHCIRNGFPVRFVKNDNIRLWAKCKIDHCDWAIHVAKMSNDSCWQVRTFHDKHNKCSWDLKNKCITSTWLGKTFSKRFNTNPKLGTIEFRDEICGSLKADVSRKVAYLAKKKALQMVQGTAEEQFRQIRRYCPELKRSDDGATVVLKLTEDDEGQRFQRLYICFSACREGFKNACRRVIGVDGCFLKEKYGGQLLSAVGLDPNNNIFPICYALVERETADSWTWFLQLLDKDIGISNDQYAWTFMSDKQKGLINAFESLFPNADNRFCVRHLLNNMKRDGFKSVAVKIAFWAAAKATRVEEFRLRMAQLKETDENAYEWLAKKYEKQWSKAFFSTSPKCDILLNNMCESFNSFILNAREKPVIEMFEMIRNLLMAKYQGNREKAGKWKSWICPKIRDVLAKVYMDAAGYYPMKSDEMHYQITRLDDRRDQHSVDLSSRSCSCRKYDLTGIPCKHAVCAIWCKKEDPESYVHSYYTVETYRRCYSLPIMPVNGPDLWPTCDLVSPLPPVFKEKVGRPAKLRRRESDEPPPPSQKKLKGVKKYNKCKKCGGFGHNQRTCSQQEVMTQRSSTAFSNEVRVNLSSSNQRSVDDNLVPTRKEKLHSKTVRKQHQAAVHVEGSSYSKASTNVLTKPAFVKGGVNFTTVSRLRTFKGIQPRDAQLASQQSTSSKQSVMKN